jgi:hypothetical protein
MHTPCAFAPAASASSRAIAAKIDHLGAWNARIYAGGLFDWEESEA